MDLNTAMRLYRTRMSEFPVGQRIKQVAIAGVAALLVACGSNDSNGPKMDSDLAAANDFMSSRTRSFDEDWKFYKGSLGADQASLVGFDDSGWRRLDLPHDWSIEDLEGGSTDGAATSQPSNLFVFEQPSLTASAPQRIGPYDAKLTEGDRQTGRVLGGEGWYRKHFAFTPSDKQRVSVRFDGVYQNSDVWINGQHLGFHPYGYTEFTYDLTPYLKSGDNVIAVRVQNIGKNSRWYSGSGIYRHTWLTTTDTLNIPVYGVGLTTQSLSANGASVNTTVTVQNSSSASQAGSVRAMFFDADGTEVGSARADLGSVAAGAAKDVALTLNVPNAHPWSPDTPYLYTAVVQVMVNDTIKDQIVEKFGVRTIQVSATDGLLLNGKPIKLRGANVHHDNGPLGAVSLDDQERWRLSTLKNAGFNSVRTAHNPPSQAMLKAADELGVILLDEFVDMWDVQKNDNDYHLYFADWWQKDVTAWILASRNHPSVGIWSIANEIYDAGAAESIGAQLMTKVRSLDGSRPIMQGGGQGIIDRFNSPTTASYVDIGDIHYQLSFAKEHQAFPNKTWMQSESYPAAAYDHWKLVTDNNFVIGDFVWAGWDYMGEAGMNVPRLIPADSGSETAFLGLTSQANAQAFGSQAGGVWGPYPWFAAGDGDFDLIGQVAPQHLYRRVVWGDSQIEMAVARPVSGGRQQQAFNFGWFDELESWTWDQPEGTKMRVHVYTSADKIDLFLDGNLLESRTLSDSDKRIGSFWVAYHPGTLRAVAYRNGTEIGRKELVTTEAPAALVLSADVQSMSTSRDSLAHVLVQVVDAQGRLVPDAVVRVNVSVSGGELAAMGSGNAHNVDSFKSGKRYSYHGKAMAYVRPSKTPGKIVVTASADGLRSATLELSARN
ncbi:glycoside hydrolase family 2 TIM barrel-domain containing protein [Niveibacterium sp. SC-1]|uniref:glycoside hydrolase family 2 TIM barrel-domain containing protein n=1 Tax=Niveibacterium sp. SC-1 TaxID=3135646 RepID=UPI00311EB9CB